MDWFKENWWKAILVIGLILAFVWPGWAIGNPLWEQSAKATETNELIQAIHGLDETVASQSQQIVSLNNRVQELGSSKQETTTSIDEEKLAEAIAARISAGTVVTGCHIIHESVLVDEMDHVSSSGTHIHVEYWWPGEPERETILTTADAEGGRFNFTRSLRGWVWEYTSCTLEEVMSQVETHIQRRLDGEANNDGFIKWKDTELFEPVKKS